MAIYDDHLEITNPGDLHFGITPEKLTKPHESKPWNPIIANVFYRAGIIERWGAGTLNIINWCTENSNPSPTWQEQAGSVYGTFLPAVLPDTPEVTPQATGQVTEEVLRLLSVVRGNMSRKILQMTLGLKGRDNFEKLYLRPALELSLLERTIPEKLNSRLQQYRLTAKGRGVLNDE